MECGYRWSGNVKGQLLLIDFFFFFSSKEQELTRTYDRVVGFLFSDRV